MLRYLNDGVTTIKPGHQTSGNASLLRLDQSSFKLFPASGRVFLWEIYKEAYNPERLVPTVKYGGGSVMIWAAITPT
jgi:hypothetical protein